MLRPRTVLPCPSVTSVAVWVSVGRVPPIEGRASLNDGTVTPASDSRLIPVAPWPISFWLLSSVNPPV